MHQKARVCSLINLKNNCENICSLSWLLTPNRCPMSTEKPMARAAEPRRPLRLSSVTAKTQMTSWRVRKISIVVAMPRLMPGCSCKRPFRKMTRRKLKLKCRCSIFGTYSMSGNFQSADWVVPSHLSSLQCRSKKCHSHLTTLVTLPYSVPSSPSCCWV